MVEARLDFIPNFLKATSPQGLRRVMLENNRKKGMMIKYFDIQFVNGAWFAWYYDEALSSGNQRD